MRPRDRFLDWLYPIGSDRWVSVLRIGLGFQLLLYLFSLRHDWISLLASNGERLSYRNVAEAMLSADTVLVPRLGWLVDTASWLHLNESFVLSMVWVILFATGALLIAGLFCRPAAITAWFLQVGATKSAGLFAYGVDNFTTIGLFYLVLSHLPDSLSLDFRIWRQSEHDVSGFIRRVLQLHLCLAYFFSGLTKSLGSGWWNGVNMWRALTRPPLNVLDSIFIHRWHFLLPFIGLAICALEVSYPIFIWPRQTRAIWLALMISMHVAIGAFMGMYLFASVMIILNVAAFATNLNSRRPQVAIGGHADSSKTIFSRPQASL